VHEDAFEAYVSGRAAFERGHLNTAEAAFLAMVGRDDVATDAVVLGHAHVGLAQVALARQQLEGAARYLSLADLEVEAVEGELRARLLTNISALWSELGNVDRSRAALERLLALLDSSPVETFLQRHDLLIAAAELSVGHGRLADAERLLVRADELAENESERAASSYWRARIAQERGNPLAASAYFEAAFAGAEAGEKKPMALADTALMHYDAGNLTAAEQGFRELLDTATGQADARGLAHGYAGLARIATDRNQQELASEYGGKAVDAAATSGDAEAMAIALTAVGIVLARLGDLDGAANAYTALGELLDAAGPMISESTRRCGRAALQSNEAVLAARRGDVTAIERLAANTPAPSLPSREELDDLVQSGISRVMVGDWDGAKHILVSALHQASNMGQVGAKLRAALELAAVYSLQGQFEPAHRACGEGIEALKQLRAPAGAEQVRVTYVKDKADAYTLMVRLCLILAATQRRRPRLREAVEYVERAKSRVLADTLCATALRLPEAVPLELAEAERAALEQIRELDSLTRTADAAAEEAFAQAQALLDELVARIGVFVPEYESLRRGVPATFAEMRSLVGERSEGDPR
jgi:tetratricopeptide (TPR) repeat protein